MTYLKISKVGTNKQIAVIELNRPEARNAFNTQMATEILEALQSISKSDARVVVISSTNTIQWGLPIDTQVI